MRTTSSIMTSFRTVRATRTYSLCPLQRELDISGAGMVYIASQPSISIGPSSEPTSCRPSAWSFIRTASTIRNPARSYRVAQTFRPAPTPRASPSCVSASYPYSCCFIFSSHIFPVLPSRFLTSFHEMQRPVHSNAPYRPLRGCPFYSKFSNCWHRDIFNLILDPHSSQSSFTSFLTLNRSNHRILNIFETSSHQ